MTTITVYTPSQITPSADISELVSKWEMHLGLQVSTGELSQNTATAYRRGWNKFYSWLVSQDIYQVSSDHIRGWIAQLRSEGRTTGTINVWFAGVKAFFSWAVGARFLAVNPCEGVKSASRKGAPKGHKRDVLTDAEVRRVLEQPDTTTPAGKRDKAILALKAYTAVRDVELHRADLSDLRTQNGALVLFVTGKGHDSADDFVVLPPEAETAVYDWCAVRGGKPGPLFLVLGNRAKGERLSLRSIRKIVKGCYTTAGVRGDRKTSHSLRHTAITNAIRHGVPIQKVKSMARHASIDTTMIYFHEVDRISDPAESYIKYDLKGAR